MKLRHLLLPATLALAVSLSAAYAQDATPEAADMASVNVTATYVLPDQPIGAFVNSLIPDSVDNDRGFLLGGIGSDLWHGPSDPADEFWMITDRGPNGEVEADGKTLTTFPIPGFDPVILHVKAADGELTILEAFPITTQSGAPVTGLPNLESRDAAAYAFDGSAAFDYNPNGVDSEGLVRTSTGEFWIDEEYTPSILHLDATGKVLERFIPEGLTYEGADYPVSATLPAIYANRKANRGFEGLTMSADETTLYAVLQSPLSNPDSKIGNASRNTRVLVFDIATGKPTAEYVYLLDDAVEFAGEGAKASDMKLSAVAFVNPTTLLIDERTDTAAKFYLVDLSAATNILGSAWNDPATSPSLEGTADLAAAGVTPLPKTLVLDVTPLIAGIGKLEGVAILDKSTIVIANDNDFNIGDFDADGNNITAGNQSQLLTITLPAPLP